MKIFFPNMTILATICLLGTFTLPRLQAQTVIGGDVSNPSALLDLQSTTRGFLPPRMTSAERSAIANPATGLFVFNTTLSCLEMNMGTPSQPVWTCLSVTSAVSVASSSPSLCVGTPLTPITHATAGATDIGSATNLPPGVSASWSSNMITISGTPTAAGAYSYSVPLTGGCGSAEATGTITVLENTAGPASDAPALCVNTTLTPITHTTTGATDIGSATNLPPGVSASWASNTITISGTPTGAGTYNYSIPLMGGCGSVEATGTITVLENAVGIASATPTLCINTELTPITHTTTGATGIGSAINLPPGVSSSWVSNTITLSGTPTAAGTYNYSVPLTGGCGSAAAAGTITVLENTAGVASAAPTLCINTSLTPITHTTTGATGIGSATNLPPGISAAWASNTIAISGTPTASGTYSYSIPLIGGCGIVEATGTITVLENTVGAASSAPTLCLNTPLTPITHTTTGATGIGSATNLPPGVSASWASNTITISGTPTAAGTYNYSIPLTGVCGSMSATGTITVPSSLTGCQVCGVGQILTFSCYNLGAAATTDPYTPRWELNGHYYQWGRAAVAAAGPTGPLSGEANSGSVTGWDGTFAPNGAWSDMIKTANDPCPAGFRVPTKAQWDAVLNTNLNPTRSTLGTWSESSTNYSFGLRIGSGTTGLYLPAAGVRLSNHNGREFLRGGYGFYWSSTESGNNAALILFFEGSANPNGDGRNQGMSVRCVTEICPNPENYTVTAASASPSLCINTALTPITHTTTGATGIGSATNLPPGISVAWASNTITISGTPTVAGTYNYSIPLTGVCGIVEATGTITVLENTVGTASSTPTLNANTALTPITHSTTGATGIGSATNLPTGVSASWASNTITISGTPTAAGTYSYSIPLTGGCGSVSATGTITVNNCGAFVASGVWKAFMCHNLGADQSANPFTPSWQINGHYYQWGRAAVAVAGPTGPDNSEANSGVVTGWNTTAAANGAWMNSTKTANDPCPIGFRVPTKVQWDAVIDTSLNTRSNVGADWTTGITNYGTGLRTGSGNSGLFLPSAGLRDVSNGSLFYRGNSGNYWSSTESGSSAWYLLLFNGGAGTYNFDTRPNGLSVRCIAE